MIIFVCAKIDISQQKGLCAIAAAPKVQAPMRYQGRKQLIPAMSLAFFRQIDRGVACLSHKPDRVPANAVPGGIDG